MLFYLAGPGEECCGHECMAAINGKDRAGTLAVWPPQNLPCWAVSYSLHEKMGPSVHSSSVVPF